jgi:hypothetical protein
MARVKVTVHEEGIAAFLEQNKQIRDQLVGVARGVAAEAQATADSAQEGSGGRISGYAEAGFAVEWQARGGKRPRVNVVSKADPKTALAAHFHTQKRDGVAHLRAALYRFTRRG